MNKKEFHAQQDQFFKNIQKQLVFQAFPCNRIISVCTDSGV